MQCIPLGPRRSCLSLAVIALFTAGCQDSLTTPDAAVPKGSSHASQGANRNPVVSASDPFACLVGVAAPDQPNTYRYNRLKLEFPKSALAPDGATMVYRYRGFGQNGQVRALANCIIPRTIPAVEQMNRRFKMPPRSGLPAGGGRPSGDISVQCGTEAEPCQLDPIEVVAPAPPPNDDGGGSCTTQCPGDGFGTPPGTGGGGGGGDTSSGADATTDLAAPEEGVKDGDICPNCDERDPNAREQDDMRSAIDFVSCGYLKQYLLDKLANREILIFKTQPPEAVETGNWIWGEQIGSTLYIWVGHWRSDGSVKSSKWLADTLVHEAAHAWWRYDLSVPPHGTEWQGTMADCGFPQTRY